ncbi:MAG TPA: SRPBCC domain-containing protein [Candidatus Limnocylindrales bacterium]|nr:SRPBCC domain-containing protein [Candidatus Limnocylindrales bacterium]
MATTVDEIRSGTTINAPIERVWQAITTPSEMKQWFFGVDTEADWRPGGRLVHRGEYDGKPYIDKGEIVEFEPPRRLVHTHWSDVSGLPDAPEHYQVVAWDLTRHDGATDITITERNLPSDAAARTSEQGWASALKALKELLER